MARKVIDLRKKKPGGLRVTASQTAGGRRGSPLRAWRRKVRIYGAAVGCIVLVATLPYVSDFTYHSRVTLGDVSVAGAARVSPNLIKAFFERTLHDGTYHFLSRSNIFWYPRDVLETEIQKGVPRIKSVNVERNGLLAQAVTVTVEERERYGVWCNETKQCFEIDESGFIFAEIPKGVPMRGYTFSGAIAMSTLPIGETYLGEHIQNVVAFLELLEKNKLKPAHIASDGAVDYWVELESGISLRVALSGFPEEIARNLELALSSDALRGQTENLEYVDLRFGNKLYYKTR
ncbi:hypothetical protein A2673_02195 [Candidatus Kaiserbacteria bacterium RIFCSPHIGHO2_01_FULL_50_13]|uniref:POTRA domain-containing protein n=1 Tax=Candidatus Kaiserbacteria bacterium RIFCSPLOWO2_01_FULL_50_24 TaxID=1798507 RepID=A0A1F6ER63_9BACT|nr:MAG: hypothetical protein A2673_02195 [Candidatus Kaiserbacteria bacterium RIFCSPHIGHO2_01_FULL_50_13]OGG76105.1 MAG: hypothetical protein A3A34_00775 [Candidatus Kaiserbacteria bacterium RIFCSPLOWO2_01_FULL_50_24]OGG82364.1 MAG: hypothetical protein A3H74_00145 [Candidatus Kaiserbacteria bacterium RIFCSPLOWO2_02_FULL_51_13]